MATTGQKSNADIVRTGYEAFAKGDMDTLSGLMADDIEWIEPEGGNYGGTYHGFDEILERVFEPSMESVEGFEVAADRYIDCGDAVVVLGTYSGMEPESGDRFEIPFAHVCELEEGKLTAFRNYTDTAQWQAVLEA